MDSLPTFNGQYHHMPQQVASAVLPAPIEPGPGFETSGAHAPEGTRPSSRDQGHDRLQTRSPTRGNKRSGGNKRLRCEWSDAENEFLITCKQACLGNGGRPSKGKATCTHWDEIRAKFGNKFGDRGQVKSSDQIRHKWDTFLKSYKTIKKFLGHKNYSELADEDFDDDVGDLKLAIRLTREWYIIIDQCQVSSQQPSFPTSGLLDSHLYVASDQSSPIQIQAYSQPPALQSASPGSGGNSPTHSQTTYDHPPFVSSGNACVEITPDDNHRQPESRFPSGASPAIVMRQSAPTTFMPWSDPVQATNRADIQDQAPPTQNEGNNINHPRVQNLSPGTAYYPFTHGQASHPRPPCGHLAETDVHFRSVDGHGHAENIQTALGATSHVMTGDQGQSGQLPIAAPSIDIASTQSPRFQDEAQQLRARRTVEQVAIPYFNELSEITKSVLLDLIVCDIPNSLRNVCQWLASLHDDDPINMMASVQELALHGLLDTQPEVDMVGPLQWGTSGMWRVKLEEKKEYQKFVLNVIRKYPKHQIHLHIRHDGHRDLQRAVQRSSSEGLELFTGRGGGGLIFGTSVQHEQLKDLCVYQCTDLLREVDLRNLPNLRSFTIKKCRRAIVTGWAYATKLEWLMVEDCDSVDPEIEHLSALKYLHLYRPDLSCPKHLETNLLKSSQVQSMTLSCFSIFEIKHLATLENLQSLNLAGSTIRSGIVVDTISALHSLMELSFCGSDFGADRGPEYILDLSGLRLLSSLDISWTSWTCIRGVEKLENLTCLNCVGSELEHLPDLSHLNKLRWVDLEETPFEKKLGSGDLPAWLSKVREVTVLTASEWNDSPASHIFFSDSESGSE